MADYFEKAFNLSLDRIFEKYKDVDDSFDSIIEFDVDLSSSNEKIDDFQPTETISEYTMDPQSDLSFHNFSFVKNRTRENKSKRNESVDNFNRLYNIIHEGPSLNYDDLYNLIFHNGY